AGGRGDPRGAGQQAPVPEMHRHGGETPANEGLSVIRLGWRNGQTTSGGSHLWEWGRSLMVGQPGDHLVRRSSPSSYVLGWAPPGATLWAVEPQVMGVTVGLGGIEPPTSALSVLRSNRLSYSPALTGRSS